MWNQSVSLGPKIICSHDVTRDSEFPLALLQLAHLFIDGASNLGAVVSTARPSPWPCRCVHWFAFKCWALEVALPEFMATIYKQLWFRAKCLSIESDAASSGVLSMRSLLGSFIDFLVWHLSRPPIAHDNLSHLICIWNALGTSKFPIANHNDCRGEREGEGGGVGGVGQLACPIPNRTATTTAITQLPNSLAAMALNH